MSSVEYFQRVHAAVSSTDTKLDALSASVALLAHNQERRASPATATAGGGEVITSPTAALVTPEVPRRHRVQIPLMWSTPVTTSSATVTTAVTTILPPAPTIYTDITLSNLLYMWYAFDMYVVSEGMSQQQRSLRISFAKAVCYCKCFLPAGTVLTSRPSSGAAADAWVTSMRKLGADAQRGVMDCIAANTAPTGRAKKPNVVGCMVHLQKLACTAFPSPVIVDKAAEDAQARGLKCFFYKNVYDIKQ